LPSVSKLQDRIALSIPAECPQVNRLILTDSRIIANVTDCGLSRISIRFWLFACPGLLRRPGGLVSPSNESRDSSLRYLNAESHRENPKSNRAKKPSRQNGKIQFVVIVRQSTNIEDSLDLRECPNQADTKTLIGPPVWFLIDYDTVFSLISPSVDSGSTPSQNMSGICS
jgi:hypothetical protein